MATDTNVNTPPPHLYCAPILLGAALLLWPAALNGYPLVFSDTGTYLSQAIQHYLGWDRPIFYSLFLLPLHLTLTTWPVIVVQALLAAHTLHLLRRALLPAMSAWWLVPLLAALALASALPWLASQLMPDLFTGLLVLTLGLLGFAAASLSQRERIWLTGFSAFMIATHQSHLLLALLLLPGLLALRWWLGPGTLREVRRDAGPLLAASLLACIALIGVNLIAYHRASVAPFSNVFSLARVIYDGPGMRVLRRDCPRAGWRLCPYLDQFPAIADDFLWREDGPLIRAGGAKAVSTEANAIMALALAAEPGEELRAVLANTARQLARFATGDGLNAWPTSVTPWILRDFPRFEANAYLASRQTNDRLVLPAWLLMLHRAVALIGAAACCALLPCALHRRHRVGGFLALVLLALPVNALITGGLSGPHDRYQSRVMWLPPLLAALAIPALFGSALFGPALFAPALLVPALLVPAPARRSAAALASPPSRAPTDSKGPPQSARSTQRRQFRRIARSALSFLPLRALRALRWILLAGERAPRPRRPSPSSVPIIRRHRRRAPPRADG